MSKKTLKPPTPFLHIYPQHSWFLQTSSQQNGSRKTKWTNLQFGHQLAKEMVSAGDTKGVTIEPQQLGELEQL